MKYPQFLTLSIIYLVFLFSCCQQTACGGSGIKTSVKVGVILNMETSLGRISNSCIAIAVEDFYKASPNYKTKVELHTRNSGNAVTTALFQAMDLLKELEVHVIVGPQTSAQAETVAEVGNSALVPVVSFSATSPAISRTRMPYFIRMTQNDTYQLETIGSIVQKFGWKHVIIIYEETDYVNDVIPNLVDMLQDIGVSVPYKAVISPKAEDLENKIVGELEKLKTMQTRTFIVHMSYSLGPLFFRKVKDVGLMSEGNAWIVTEELTSFFSHMTYPALDSMRGAVGIKTYIQRSDKLDRFRLKMIPTMVQESTTLDSLNTFCLKAYDTIWAIATAAETLGPDTFREPRKFKNKEELADMGISQSGPQLLEQILKSKFDGLSGEICFIDGELKPQVYQIVNVVGPEMEIGFWLPDAGLSRTPYDSSNSDLAPIIWPGESIVVPKGWVIPANGEKLKVGYIVKEFFPELVTINREGSVTGYCIDIFKAVMSALLYEFPYDFVPFENINGDGGNTYEDLVDQVEEYHAVVGDITVTSNRSLYVDFALPFTTGGVAMIVPTSYKKMNPFFAIFRVYSKGVWCSWVAAFLLSVMVISFFEYTPDSQSHQIGNIVSIAWTLLCVHTIFRPAFQLKISDFVKDLYMLICYLLFGGFLALTLIKKHEYPQLIDVNIKELMKSGASVGYQKHSFVEMVLKQQKFDQSQLKAYSSPEEYDEALKKGSKNGGVAAIFDELPYVEVFLKKYCGKYRKILLGPTIYRIEGFGFVFPLGSPLVPAVSRAILAVVGSEQMAQIEAKWLGNCPDLDINISSNNLVFMDFWVLFAIFTLIILLVVIGFVVLPRMTPPQNWIRKKQPVTVSATSDANSSAEPNEGSENATDQRTNDLAEGDANQSTPEALPVAELELN